MGKAENTNEAAGLDGLDCLASKLGLNSTPSGKDSYISDQSCEDREMLMVLITPTVSSALRIVI